MTHIYVEFDGLHVWGRGSASPHDLQGFGIKRNGLEQFEDSASRSGDRAQRDVGDGEYWGDSSLGGITRTLQGVAWARSHREVEAMHDDLSRLFASGVYRPLTFRSENGYRFAMGRPEGSLTWSHDRWVHPPRAEFSIAFHCADPWWNGEQRFYSLSAGQTREIENRGQMPAWPRVEVRGPVNSGWGVGVGAERLYVDRAVAAGETVTVDLENGEISSSTGGTLTGLIRGWESSLAPGVGTFTFSGVGSGTATVTITDRFL